MIAIGSPSLILYTNNQSEHLIASYANVADVQYLVLVGENMAKNAVYLSLNYTNASLVTEMSSSFAWNDTIGLYHAITSLSGLSLSYQTFL